MKTVPALLLAALVAAGAGYGGYWYGAHHGPAEHAGDEAKDPPSTAPAEDEKPVVAVITVPLQRKTLAETVTAYGSVVAQQGDVRAFSVPFESRVARVRVAPGQRVAAGDLLVTVEPSADAQVALQEAKNAVEAATRDLAPTQQRFNEHLATNQDLSQAQQAVRSAQLKLDSLLRRGAGQTQEIKADGPSIVSKVDVQEGQVAPAGAPLVELAAGDRIEIRLGIDPTLAADLKPGQPVQLHDVGQSPPTTAPTAAASPTLAGQVRTIGQRVDPVTHLVDVTVSPPPGSRLLLDSFVAGDITRASASGALVVPRDAALPDDHDAYVLYTVRGAHAVKHTVRLGLQSADEVQVIADDLNEGDRVVVSGNYLLQDGMEVEVKAPEPAAPEPATNPAPTEAKP